MINGSKRIRLQSGCQLGQVDRFDEFAGLDVPYFESLEVGQLLINPFFVPIELERTHAFTRRHYLYDLTVFSVVDIQPVQQRIADVKPLSILRKLRAMIADDAGYRVDRAARGGIDHVDVIHAERRDI